jgi:hypothetical protein
MLSHGSFGVCPRVVFERQGELRRQMESRPVQFFVRVPVYFFPALPRVVLRVSAPAYNEPGHYQRLVEAVQQLWR